MSTPTTPRPHTATETATERRARQLDCLRRASDQAMRAIEIAGEQLEAAHRSNEPGATASPNLDLARAIRGLVLAINAENRALKGDVAPRAPASDTRRNLLRDALHKAAKTEPDPKRRAERCRAIDERIEETLLADPEAEIPVAEHLAALADDFHLAVDYRTLPDELIGVTKMIYPPPTGDHVRDNTLVPWTTVYGKNAPLRPG